MRRGCWYVSRQHWNWHGGTRATDDDIYDPRLYFGAALYTEHWTVYLAEQWSWASGWWWQYMIK